MVVCKKSKYSLKFLLLVTVGVGCSAGLLGIGYRQWSRAQLARQNQGERVGRETLAQLGAKTVWSDGKLTEIYVTGQRGLVDPDHVFGGMDNESLQKLRFFSDIEVLYIDVGTVSDVGLRVVARFERLETLGVDGQKIEGPCVRHLRRLRHLRHLSLQDNSLDDYFGRQIGRLTQLESLSLRGNPVGDGALEGFGALGKLKRLDLRATRISDAGLTHLTSLSSLEELDVSFTSITDAGLRSIAKLKNLRVLSLGGYTLSSRDAHSEDDAAVASCLKGLGLKYLRQLPQLRELRLADAPIGDEQIRELIPSVAIEYLDLTNTEVTEKAVAPLLQLPNLKSVNAWHTGIDVTRPLRHRPDGTSVHFEFSRPPER